MAELKTRYKTRFEVSAHPYTPPAEEQMVATASLDKLRALLPAGIDPDAHPTLLYIAANLAVAGVVNLNDDAMTLEDTLRTHRAFEWQLVDIEHDRSQLRGFIVKAGLSELGTDRLISEAEARAAGKPVNIAVIIALWKVADPELCSYIERMDAPASPDRGKLSLSFEVGFDDYDIVVLPNGTTNLSLASQVVTPDAADFGRYDRLLRVNGGKGALGKDSRVARIIMGNIVPLGAGIVTVPAAAVKGLTTITSSPHVDEAVANAVEAGLYKYSSTQCTLAEHDAAPFQAYAASIPDEHIYTDPDDPTLGRDKESHITACYGLTTAEPTQVQACLASCAPVSVTLGEISAFENPDKPYDVLKVDVHSDDLHRVHHLIKTATEVKSSFPDYHPHLTLAYVKKGMARGYVGDTRFKGKTLTFASLTFSPHTGDRVEIPLTHQLGARLDDCPTQSVAAEVYSPSEAMSTVKINAEFVGLQESLERQVRAGLATAAPSRQIKLSEGWQTQLAALQTQAGKEGNAPLVNGVSITLSDGRTFSNVKVFDGSTLELDKELSMAGVVITSMTPGVPPQADSPEVLHPHKALTFPTTCAEQQARDAANEAKRHEGQNAAYTDASLKLIAEADKRFAVSVSDLTAAFSRCGLDANVILAGVSPSTPSSPMDITQLKQSLAAVKSVEDLPTAVANVSLFADAIAAASEKLAAERKTAQDAAQAALASVEQVKADLAALTKTHNEMVASQQAQAAEDAFNQHMAAVEATFDLDTEVRAEIVDEVKAAASDEAFAKWMTSAKKKMKGFIKKGEKAKDDCAASATASEDAAAVAAKTALASAAANPVDPVHTHDFAATPGLVEQMQAAFAGGISVNGIRVKDIVAKKK